MEIKTCIDLGFAFARVSRNEQTGNVRLAIFQPSSVDEGAYSPAESIEVFMQAHQVEALRDALGKGDSAK